MLSKNVKYKLKTELAAFIIACYLVKIYALISSFDKINFDNVKHLMFQFTDNLNRGDVRNYL